MRSRAFRVAGVVVAAAALCVPAALSGTGESPAPDDALLRLTAFHPLDPAAYAATKAAADARAGDFSGSSEAAPASPFAPTVFANAEGQNMLSPLQNIAPSDSTGAIGPTSYVELINQKMGIYSRTLGLMDSKSLNTLTGLGGSDSLFDVQIIWDGQSNRFFYAMDDVRNTSNNLLAWGFSKTGSPATATPADWCSYQSNFGTYGSDFPDYPKLGDTKDFLLIGVNRFNGAGTAYLGSDVAWATKPPAGTITSCPPITSFKLGVKVKLKNVDGSLTSTPVPANQTDPAGTGYVVGNHDVGVGGSATDLSVFKVTKNTVTGAAKFSVAKSASVASYSAPPSAPQAGTAFRLDTLDGRLTQAVSGLDGNHLDPGTGKPLVGLWTQQTIATPNGLASEVRWYEIDPKNATLFQSGDVTAANTFVFNGAITPDRLYFKDPVTAVVTKKFGSNMGLGFDTSSLTADVAVKMVSKIGAGPVSSFVLVKQSPGPNADFTCSPVCRWGDYAGASPDPSPTLTSGQVWFTSMWNHASSNTTNIDWTTQNWGATP